MKSNNLEDLNKCMLHLSDTLEQLLNQQANPNLLNNIENDEHNRILAENLLGGWLTDYVIVEDGQQAIDLLGKKIFDIALIDIHMPNKNGIDVVQYVRADNQGINFKTPIVFMTANAFKSDINMYMKAGFDDYLIKPFREAELYNKLCIILAVKPDKNDKMLMVEIKNPEAIQKDVFNTDELWRTANGDRAFFEKMVNNFIVNAVGLVSVFVEGTANGELARNRRKGAQISHIV